MCHVLTLFYHFESFKCLLKSMAMKSTLIYSKHYTEVNVYHLTTILIEIAVKIIQKNVSFQQTIGAFCKIHYN